MTRHERLLFEARYGSSEEQEAARAIFKAQADTQNAKEKLWPLSRLCRVLYDTGNGKRLTIKQRSLGSLPHALTLPNGDVQVFSGRDCHIIDRVACKRTVNKEAKAFYTGPLADYWRTALTGYTPPAFP